MQGWWGQLLKRCYRDGIDPINLTDQTFTAYIVEIRLEPAKYNPAQPKKTENSVIATGKVWLDFLVFVGTSAIVTRISFQRTAPSVRARRPTTSKSGRQKSLKSHLRHHSFGKPHRVRHRDPVTSEQIQMLRAANRKDKASDFVKMRRLTMIEMFTDLGPRRGELTNLKVQDVRNALALGLQFSALRLDTLKREEGAERFRARSEPDAAGTRPVR